MSILLFNYTDVLKTKSNPRLLAYYTYLEKQGKSPCFCFLKSAKYSDVQYKHKSFGNPRLPGFVNTIWGLFRASIYVLQHKHEAIYIYGSHLVYLPIYLIGKLKGIPITVEKTELDSSKPIRSIKDVINYPLYKIDEWLMVKLNLKLVVITQNLHDHYHNKGHRQIQLTGMFLPEIQHPNKDKSESTWYNIGYLGSFADKDDFETLIDALYLVAHAIPNLELTLIGKPNLTHLKGKHPFRIRVLGELAQQDIIPHLQHCNVLIAIRKKQPFSTYGFPSKLGEYFLSEVPIICSDNIYLPPAFIEEKGVFSILTENQIELSKVIDYLYTNPGIAEQVGKKGHELAKKHFDTQMILAHWYAFVFERDTLSKEI